MTIPDILIIVALILAGIDIIRSRGEALTSWAVFLVCVALLYTLIF